MKRIILICVSATLLAGLTNSPVVGQPSQNLEKSPATNTATPSNHPGESARQRPQDALDSPQVIAPKTAAIVEGGDNVDDATVITALPYVDTGTTEGYTNDYAGSCSWDDGAPDVVYSFSPGSDIAVDINLCSSPLWNTTMYVFESSPDNEIACNDDGCSVLSMLLDVSLRTGNTYYIVVDGVGNNSGEYIIDVSESRPCGVGCPLGAVYENEPECGDNYIDNYNGGCNSEPPIFQPINAGDMICGKSGTFILDGIEFRDTDWYELTVNEVSRLTWKVVAEFPPFIFLIDSEPDGCQEINILQSRLGAPCDTMNVTDIVAPGVYWLWVGPSEFAGWPCPLKYVGWVTLEPYVCTPDVFVNLPDDMPYVDPGNTTCGRVNDFDPACLGRYFSGEDIIYQLTVASPLTLDIMLDPRDTLSTGILVDDACPPDRMGCIAAAPRWGADPYGITRLPLGEGTYYLMVDCRFEPYCIPSYDLTIQESSPLRPGDWCGEPFIIPESFPYSDSGSTCDFTNQCEIWRTNNKDVIYRMDLSQPYDLTISLCGSLYDTKLAVFADSCCTGPGTEMLLNDDLCGVQSEVGGHFEAGTYYVVVDGYLNFCGDYRLDVMETIPCVLTCPPSAVPEGEPDCGPEYVDEYNAGCLSTPPLFTQIQLGDVICGTSGIYPFEGFERRDFDWYRFDLNEQGLITCSVCAEFPVSLFLLDARSGDCTDYSYIRSIRETTCDTTSLTANLTPGAYWVYITPTEITGWPCPLKYTLWLSQGGCTYVPGDANGFPPANGLDVTYMVNYFKGGPNIPPDVCDCPGHGLIFSAGDANGSCVFNGIDVTYLVNYLKGIGGPPLGCPDCPPSGLTLDNNHPLPGDMGSKQYDEIQKVHER